MNPAIFTMLAWEKELEIRQASPRSVDQQEGMERGPRPKRSSFVTRISRWIRHPQTGDCPRSFRTCQAACG